MGAILSQQASLRINREWGLVERDKLEVGKEYHFKKKKHRLYILNTPMELLTEYWKAVARIIITEYTVGDTTEQKELIRF